MEKAPLIESSGFLGWGFGSKDCLSFITTYKSVLSKKIGQRLAGNTPIFLKKKFSNFDAKFSPVIQFSKKEMQNKHERFVHG